MKKVLYIFFLLSLFLGISVANAGSYKIKNNKVYYKYDGQTLADNSKLYEVIGADAKSFKTMTKKFKIWDGIHDFYCGKDKKNVFCFGKIIEGVDVKTFNYVGVIINIGDGPYILMKDKTNVYAMFSGDDLGYDNNFHIFSGADPKTIKTLSSEGFSKDKNHVYYEFEVFTGADVKTFQPISIFYSKDKNHVYNSNKIIEGADPKTFKIVSSNDPYQPYSKDKKSVYYGGKKVEGADPKTFIVVKDSPKITNNNYISTYSKDKSNVYYYGEKLTGADPKTFKYLNATQYKDKNHIYEDGKIVK